jgi:dTDP-4-dehydrorhamnose reductase
MSGRVRGPILLIGGRGQIGWELRRSLSPLGAVLSPGLSELDLAKPQHIADYVRAQTPRLIVNAAAYTDVDGAESAEEAAVAVNATAPGVLAEEAKRLGIGLVHYSTDYVFDGVISASPAEASGYREDDPPNPLNAYGRSKLAGEQAVRQSGVAHLVLRTSWVYSARRRNFLLTMRRLAQQRDELRVVDDQMGSPTGARFIAEATTAILAASRASEDSAILRERGGLYHLSAAGRSTWYGFAAAILDQLRNGHDASVLAKRVVPITSAEFPQAARRPAFSVLDCSAAAEEFGVLLPSWHEQLDFCLEDIGSVGLA